MSFISYAQNYEDVMLFRALRDIERGFYIDVGAADPVDDSVTKAFYERGWRGINIEPVTHWFQRLVADRPHDVNLQLAVSDGPGQLHLFEVKDSGLSTTDPEFAARHAQAGHQICELDVNCLTLDEICEIHQVGEVHFLKIDCEGGEAATLRGFSLERVRPWVIVLEATEPNSQKPAYMEWEPSLTKRGYHFAYEDGLNRFYVADERRELDPAFSHPPNVFDYFVRASEAVARSHLEVAQSDLSAMRDAQRLARVESECEQLRKNAEFLRGENERREAALVEYRQRQGEAAEREAQGAQRMQVEIDQLRDLSEQLREKNGELKQTLSEQQQTIAMIEVALAASRGDLKLSLEHAAAQEREVLGLRNEIGRLHRSSSWRITLPLRLVMRGARATMVTLGWIAYNLLRSPARLARPLLRLMAKPKWLRSLAVRVAGVDSALTRHTRLFLFGKASAAEPHETPRDTHTSERLSGRAQQVLVEIQDVSKKRPHG